MAGGLNGEFSFACAACLLLHLDLNKMAFSDIQRDQIRTYMGYPLLFRNANSILDNAMNSIESLNDSSATENAMKAVLVELSAIDVQISQNSTLMLATEVMDEVKFDAIRNDAGLRKVGRGLIQKLAIRLSMRPQLDYFSSPSLSSYSSGVFMHDA